MQEGVSVRAAKSKGLRAVGFTSADNHSPRLRQLGKFALHALAGVPTGKLGVLETHDGKVATPREVFYLADHGIHIAIERTRGGGCGHWVANMLAVAANEGDFIAVYLKERGCTCAYAICTPTKGLNSCILVKRQRIEQSLISPIVEVITRQFNHVRADRLQGLKVGCFGAKFQAEMLVLRVGAVRSEGGFVADVGNIGFF